MDRPPTLEDELQMLKEDDYLFVKDQDYYNQIENLENLIKYGCPKERMRFSVAGAQKRELLKSVSYATFYENYESQLAPVHNQGSYGTCYMETASLMIEFYVYMHTGVKYTFSRNEIWDCAADSKGKSKEARQKNKDDAVSYGHTTKALNAAYNFNSKLNKHAWHSGESEICKIFKSLIDASNGGSGGMIKTISSSGYVNPTSYNFADALKRYGLLSVHYNTRAGDSSSSHAVTMFEANRSSFTIRNSWGEGNKNIVFDSSFCQEHGAHGIYAINNVRKCLY